MPHGASAAKKPEWELGLPLHPLLQRFMDAFLTVLIDGVCHLSGKGTCWLLQKMGLPVPPLSFGGYVVVGLAAIVAFVALLIMGALLV